MAKIIGNTTVTPYPRPDWNQTGETKADYIKNKPTLGVLASKDEIERDNLADDVQTSLKRADSAIQSLDGLATEDYVNDKLALKVNKEDIEITLNEKQDKLTVGDGISIDENNTISVIGGDIDITVDQTYDATSENAQSGTAVADAIDGFADNLKTINNQSLIGAGDITISADGVIVVDSAYNPESENAQSGKAVAEAISQADADMKEWTDNHLDKKVDKDNSSNLLYGTVSSIDDVRLDYIQTNYAGDALYTTDWEGIECREDAVGEYDADKKELHFPVEMVFEKPEDYLKIQIEPITLTKGVYCKNLYFLKLPKDGIHVDEITPVVDFECHLGDYVFIYSETNPAGANEYVEITEDITSNYVIIKSRTFPNCTTTGTIDTSDGLLDNIMLKSVYMINQDTPYEENKHNAIFLETDTWQGYLASPNGIFSFKQLSGLGEVDNTSDLEKPISTATQEALDTKADKSTTYTKSEVDDKLDLIENDLTDLKAQSGGSVLSTEVLDGILHLTSSSVTSTQTAEILDGVCYLK